MSKIQLSPYQSVKTAFEQMPITIIQDDEHEFLIPTESVALGYGVVRESVRSTKRYHTDELIEGVHWIRYSTLKEKLQVVSNSHDLYKGQRRNIYWTKRGVVRLGFFIKSQKAKQFRNWAENLIIEDKSIATEYPYVYLGGISKWSYHHLNLRTFQFGDSVYFIGSEVIRCFGFAVLDIIVDKHKAWDYVKQFKIECSKGKSFEHSPCVSIEGVLFLINCLKPNKNVITFESWLFHHFGKNTTKEVTMSEPTMPAIVKSKTLTNFADELSGIQKVSLLFKYMPDNVIERTMYLESIEVIRSWFDEKLADLAERMNTAAGR